MAMTMVVQAVQRLALRTKTRTEADLQTDISVVLTAGGLNLDAEDVVN